MIYGGSSATIRYFRGGPSPGSFPKMKTIDNKEGNRYFAGLFWVLFEETRTVLTLSPGTSPSWSEVSMAAQRKTIGRGISTKDREFEELLRRAAHLAKSRRVAKLRVVRIRRKRVKAA